MAQMPSVFQRRWEKPSQEKTHFPSSQALPRLGENFNESDQLLALFEEASEQTSIILNPLLERTVSPRLYVSEARAEPTMWLLWDSGAGMWTAS